MSFAGDQSYAVRAQVNCFEDRPRREIWYFRTRTPNNPQDCIDYCNNRPTCTGFTVGYSVCTFHIKNCENLLQSHGGTTLWLKRGIKIISENKCYKHKIDFT